MSEPTDEKSANEVVADGKLLRRHLARMVNPTYQVSLEEMAEALGIEVVHDRLDLAALVDMPRSLLERAMMVTLSWGEFVASRKAVMNSVIGSTEVALRQRQEAAKFSYITDQGGRRGSKSEAEMYVKSLEEFQKTEIRLNDYKAYVGYLDSLDKQLTTVHYAVKELLRDYEKQERQIY